MRWLFAALVVISTVTAPVVGAPDDPEADPEPVGPGGTPVPTETPTEPDPGTPTSTPEPTSTPGGAPLGPTVPGSGNGSARGGGFIGGLFGWTGESVARNESATLVQQVALTIVAGIAYVPAPNNADNGYWNPTNGMFDGQWDIRQDTVMPIFWFGVVALLLLYLIGERVPLFDESAMSGWPRRLARSVILGYMSATIAGAWLDIRRGVTMLLLQDVTASSVEAELGSVVVIAAVLFLLWTDAWALVTLGLIIGAVIVAIPVGYAWLPLVFLGLALPWRLGRLVSMVVMNMWFVLTLLTLPIAAIVGYGFSIEVAPQFSQTAMALNEEQYVAFVSEAVESILTFLVKFGSIAGGVLLSHRLLGVIDKATPGIRLVPGRDDVQQGAHHARDRAQTGYQRARKGAGAAREAPGRARDGARRGAERARDGAERAREKGRSVRDRLGDRFGSDDEGGERETAWSESEGSSAGRRSGGFEGYYDSDGEFHSSSREAVGDGSGTETKSDVEADRSEVLDASSDSDADTDEGD